MYLTRLFTPKILLVFILFFFLSTRLYKINEIPPSVYWDEASIGYNAYSITQTGKDEWGKFLPLHFRAFGEFKLPVYIYTVALFVKILGLNEVSIRLPAVLFSLGTIIILFFLSKKISGNVWIGLLSSFFISISPWFFIFSRTGYEATAGLMFYLLGVLLFLSPKNNLSILLSVVSFMLSIYSYNSLRIITPLTIILLAFWNRKYFSRKLIVGVLLSVLIIFISLVPILRLYIYDAGTARLQAVGGVNVVTFIKNYLSHFSPDFIFFGDKNIRSQQKNFGQLYLPEILFLILGIYFILKQSKMSFLTLFLLLMGPIPASITRESPHALRSISEVPFISMISATGFVGLIEYSRGKYLIAVISVAIILLFFINLFSNFIFVYPVYSSSDWQYGYKKIYVEYGAQFQKYDNIVISNQYGQPYIFALYYLKYNPADFQKEVVRNSVDQWGFSTVKDFGKFKFGKVKDIVNNTQGSSLIFAGNNEEVLQTKPIGLIKFLDGSLAFRVYSR